MEDEDKKARATSHGDAKREREGTGQHKVGALREAEQHSAPPVDGETPSAEASEIGGTHPPEPVPSEDIPEVGGHGQAGEQDDAA